MSDSENNKGDGPRKCTYTNNEPSATDNVMPKKHLDENEKHNWANKTPTSIEYKNEKQDRLPTDLEMEANELFYLKELAKLKVKYYEARLEEIQSAIIQKQKEGPGSQQKTQTTVNKQQNKQDTNNRRNVRSKQKMDKINKGRAHNTKKTKADTKKDIEKEKAYHEKEVINETQDQLLDQYKNKGNSLWD